MRSVFVTVTVTNSLEIEYSGKGTIVTLGGLPAPPLVGGDGEGVCLGVVKGLVRVIVVKLVGNGISVVVMV
jgi:hypothetical protein